jgi:hypothetical protein
MSPSGVYAFDDIAIADEVLARHARRSITFHIGTRAKPPTDTGEDDDADIRVVVPGPHILAH